MAQKPTMDSASPEEDHCWRKGCRLNLLVHKLVPNYVCVKSDTFGFSITSHHEDHQEQEKMTQR